MKMIAKRQGNSLSAMLWIPLAGWIVSAVVFSRSLPAQDDVSASVAEVTFDVLNDLPVQVPLPVPDYPNTRLFPDDAVLDQWDQLPAEQRESLRQRMLQVIREEEYLGLQDPERGQWLPASVTRLALRRAAANRTHSLAQRQWMGIAMHGALDQSQAAQMWEIAVKDPYLSGQAQQKLINAGQSCANPYWRSVLDSNDSPAGHVVMALQGIAALGASDDARRIRPWLDRKQPDAVRLQAAIALAAVQPTGHTDRVDSLLDLQRGAGTVVDQNVAALLLRGDASEEAARQRRQIFDADVRGASTIALQGMADHETDVARQLAADAIAFHQDGGRRETDLRLLCLRLLRDPVDEPSLNAVVTALADPVPQIRQDALRHLIDTASDEAWRSNIIDALSKQLQSPHWQAAEQSILGLVSLGHRPAVAQYITLLEHPVPSVYVTAAWAIKQSGGSDSDCQQAAAYMDAFRQKMLPQSEAQYPYDQDRSKQLAQLAEVFGQHRYESGTDLLLFFVRRGYHPMVRASSMWALGKIYEDQPVPDAVMAQVRKSMAQIRAVDPDHPLMIFASAVTVGRLRDQQSLPLVEFGVGEIWQRVSIDAACRWAIERIDSEPASISIRQPKIPDSNDADSAD
ncbi:HEAT repeat domain-containing protein [Crateriforma spongiae]|uniref:HEAT repeat domain-containing protein n=1 Tax=Crateriforma spongiae TaxID=2724528 RepID=UPI001446FCE7|nr:HEAT repeat domain-containing protein [Crateriforma spongiae]